MEEIIRGSERPREPQCHIEETSALDFFRRSWYSCPQVVSEPAKKIFRIGCIKLFLASRIHIDSKRRVLFKCVKQRLLVKTS
jgi:hypothetical protein